MGSRRSNILIIALILVMVAGSLVIIFTKPTKLGLDLRGGVQLVYQGVPSPENPTVDREEIDSSIQIMRERIDSLGVSEPEIAPLGEDQIQVSLPDVQDTQRAIEQVGETAQLYFYDFEPNVVPYEKGVEEVTPQNLNRQSIPSHYEAVKLGSQQNTTCDGVCTVGKQFYLFEKKSREYVAGPEPSKEDLLDTPGAEAVPKDDRKFFEVPAGTIVVADQPDQDGEDPSVNYFVLRDRPELSGDELKNPEQNFDQNNLPNVTFDFTDEGRAAFEKITRDIAMRGFERLSAPYSFAIVLDGDIVSRPIIDYEENPDGIDGRTGAQISGGFSVQEAQDLATLLKLGALPLKLQLVSQSTVTATLGQQALDDGLQAGLIGLILVALFFLAYYRFLGGIAILGLGVYAIFFLALMKLIPITLTLPGIAGLILTVGVAADSNVVIFERIKEEARKGHSMISAITTGYKRGIGTIIDANVITLLTAFILFGLATAGVKGFAFTLGIGTIVSLLTAVVFTRAVLGLLGRSPILRSPSFLGAGEQKVRWNYDFAGASRWFFSMSGLILVIGAFSFATNQLNFGIDFESGTKIDIALAEEASVDEVRKALGDAGVESVDATKVQEVERPEFGRHVYQIQGTIPPDEVGRIQQRFERTFGFEAGENKGFQSQSVGPTFGEQVAKSAGWAIAFSLLLISAYVAFRFEPKYALPVLIAVVHDLLITAGIYSLVGREVSSATVAALLTILGYSLYDCVIVLDRVRENVPRFPRATFAQITNRSLSEVLTRSLITGLSTVFLITVILVFGGETLQDFAFAMMVGLLSGTYSSIFIATPILIAWKQREPGYRTRTARIRERMGYVPAFPEDNEVATVEGAAGTGKSGKRGKGGDQPEQGSKGLSKPATSAERVAEAPQAAEVEPEPEPEPKPARDRQPAAPATEEPEIDEADMSERQRRIAARRRRKRQREADGNNASGGKD